MVTQRICKSCRAPSSFPAEHSPAPLRCSDAIGLKQHLMMARDRPQKYGVALWKVSLGSSPTQHAAMMSQQ